MASFDSIVIGEDWISEHYFTTDSAKESFHGKVLELRKLWDAEKKEGRTTVRDDLLGVTTELQTALAGLAENPDAAREAHALTRTAFGYPAALSTFTAERAGSEMAIPDARLDGVTSVLFLQAVPVSSIEELLDPDTGLLIAPAVEDGKPIESASKAVSAAFRSDNPPAFVVVQGGPWLLLAEAERWAEGRYLAVDLLVVAERRHEAKGGEIDRVAAMFGKQALLPDADGNIWWTGVLEDSVKHTVGVSKDLREGIRLSIEIIANEVVRRRADQGLTLDGIEGQDLAKHSLRFLYRILFLLYAEASPEMRVLPTGAAEYDEGYGLDRLRELTLTELVSEQARTGTHLYASLATLFRLVDQGHTPAVREDTADDPAPGLEFQPLRADLFKPESTALIDDVGLGNEATQRVLEHLLLSKEAKGPRGAERGFISYAELGINQLGAVYEGLMSYTGFFAEEDLYEVAKNGDPEKGSWVVPVDRSDHLDEKDFVRALDEATGEEKPVLHRKGTFVFRLAGRERQQSASYYTPEVLTKFVVSQALEELLDQNDERTTPEQILELTICEPALGSGAFAIEAVRQLAAEYLKRKQEDLGELIDADQYPVELQKVKAHIALHQVYGVDLNATAVELAEISLWLDTMVAGLQAPWFGLHLRRGNSLIGARRSVYAPSLLAKKQWLKEPANDVPLGEAIGAGIHHFLLPSEGWGAVIDTAEAKTYAPEKREELRLWRNEIRKSPSKAIVKRLQALAQRVETLWEFTLRRLTIAESEIRRDIHLWGSEPVEHAPAVTREEIENVLSNPNGAYQRLRRVMDAWCAIWSWPVTTDVEPPDWDQWVGGLEAVLGIPPKAGKFEQYGQTSLAGDMNWQELDIAEDTDLTFAQALPIEKARDSFLWLAVAADIAGTQGFFHWELDFAPVFAGGGFDLSVGNPPWARPGFSESVEFAEYDPWWQLSNRMIESEKESKRRNLLSEPETRNSFLNRLSSFSGTKQYLSSEVNQPLLAETTPNLYRNFICLALQNNSPAGIVGLIHPPNHLKDDSFATLRKKAYHSLRRNWEFRNQLKLFSEIGNTRPYSVGVYGAHKSSIEFLYASWIFHPDTISRSLTHDGSGPPPGIKNQASKWDVTPHSSRIIRVDRKMLAKWARISGSTNTGLETPPTVSTPNRQTLNFLYEVSGHEAFDPKRLRSSSGWSETTGRRKGYYEWRSGFASSWGGVILQSPQIGVANPLFQQPNESAKSHRDYSTIDLESIAESFIPRTNYQPSLSLDRFHSRYEHWRDEPSSNFFRVAWSEMSDPFTSRTFQTCLLPPGPTHVHTINTAADTESLENTITMLGISHSIVADAIVKLSGADHIKPDVWRNIPLIRDRRVLNLLHLRTLRLNCIVREYSEAWRQSFRDEWTTDRWCPEIVVNYVGRSEIGQVDNNWRHSTPLRRGSDRRQALIEIDAIVAVALGITADELIDIYRSLFPVVMQDDKRTMFDAAGRQVPGSWVSEYCSKGSLNLGDFTVNGTTYREPYTFVDREREMRLAHSYFEQVLDCNHPL